MHSWSTDVKRRIVQAALKTAIEPIFEAEFEPRSFGFRPRRSAHDALQLILGEFYRGRRWVVETEIAGSFEAIPHERLMHRGTDRRPLAPQARARRVARRGDGGGSGAAWRERRTPRAG